MDTTLFNPIILSWTTISVGVGYWIGVSKGRPFAGAFTGFILGPVGWLLMLVGPNKRPKCPHCGGIVADNVSKCMNCGSNLNQMQNANVYSKYRTR